MNFLTTPTKWNNLELGVFKICVLSFGIIAGYLLGDTCKPYLPFLLVILVITAVWLGIRWFKKMKESRA